MDCAESGEADLSTKNRSFIICLVPLVTAYTHIMYYSLH